MAHRALRVTKSVFFAPAFWVLLALIAANLIVYAPLRHHDFLSYDDPDYVSANPYVSRGLTWRSVTWAFTTGHASNWHPLTWLSHMLDVQLYGLNAGAHHLTNVLFHIVNTILLFGLLHGTTGALGRSAFVAGLFAVHPLHVESVAWVAERKDVLSTLFWMLTLCAYVGYVRRPRLGRYLTVVLLFALGLMAKPMLVTLPFVLLMLDFWPLGRSVGLRLVWEKLPLLALSVASSIVTLIVQWRAVIGTDALPTNVRVANALVSYVAYIVKMLWPTPLAVFYPYHPSLPGWWVVGATVGLIGVSIVVIRAGRRHPHLLVGWLWYLGTLVPVIGLVQVGSQSMADRYTYVPLTGLFIIVAWGGSDLLARWPYRRITLPTAAALAISLCMVAAWVHVQHWKDSITLFEHALRVTGNNLTAHSNLGNALADQGRVSEAITHYSEALRIKPDFARAHSNLGNALMNQGRVTEAMAHYSEALQIEPDFADAHHNLGNALADQGRVTEAMAHYSEALRIKPDLAGAHNNLALALASQGRVTEAMAHYSEAVRSKPDFAEAYNNLGVALANEGRIDEASRQFREAVRIKPDYAEAHNNLGAMLESRRQISEAIRHYTEAIRLMPTYADAHYNLGHVLVRQEKLEDAARHFETALKLDPSSQDARRALDDLRSRRKGSRSVTQ